MAEHNTVFLKYIFVFGRFKMDPEECDTGNTLE